MSDHDVKQTCTKPMVFEEVRTLAGVQSYEDIETIHEEIMDRLTKLVAAVILEHGDDSIEPLDAVVTEIFRSPGSEALCLHGWVRCRVAERVPVELVP